MTTTEYSHDDMPCEELLLPALTILESLDTGNTKAAHGTCRVCGQRRGVIYQHRVRLRPRGYCVDCLIAVLIVKKQDREQDGEPRD